MLGKLLKHEWKSVWKVPAVLLGVMLVLSALAGTTFMLPVWDSDINGLELLVILIWMLFYFAIIGVSLGVTLYMAIHFYKSMFTDEGYLTHTLPVTSHELLISKILPIMAWSALTTIGIFASVGIFGGMAVAAFKPAAMTFGEIFERVLEELTQAGVFGNIGWEAFLGSLVFLGITGLINGAMMIVGSVSIGQLVGKHKVLGSIGAYFALNTVIQIVSSALIMPVMLVNVKNDDPASVFDVLAPTYFAIGVVAILVSAGLYFLSEYLIRRKLNLD
ncbi:MAG: hypothetical protein ACI4SD_08850 [Suilimivivens sp.]